MAVFWPPVLSAARAVPAAATISATATRATHSKLCSANATRMSTGAATTRTSAIHRSTPRLARNQYAPARTAHTPITLSAASARLRHPATAITSATAASIRANEARASQRRVITVIRCLLRRECVSNARRRCDLLIYLLPQRDSPTGRQPGAALPTWAQVRPLV